MEKRYQIPHIVRIRQKLRRWRWKAHAAAQPPPDVPSGHVAVVVGAFTRRYVVRAAILNHPIFRRLLVKSEEEYGFAHPGPLAFPCDEPVFEAALRIASLEDLRSGSCRGGARRMDAEFRGESQSRLSKV